MDQLSKFHSTCHLAPLTREPSVREDIGRTMFHNCPQSMVSQVDAKTKLCIKKSPGVNRFNQFQLIQMDEPPPALKNSGPARNDEVKADWLLPDPPHALENERKSHTEPSQLTPPPTSQTTLPKGPSLHWLPPQPQTLNPALSTEHRGCGFAEDGRKRMIDVPCVCISLGGLGDVPWSPPQGSSGK